jgi:hypothetical protein
MPIVHECAGETCLTLTMGIYCAEHERADREDTGVDEATDAFLGALAVTPLELRRTGLESYGVFETPVAVDD